MKCKRGHAQGHALSMLPGGSPSNVAKDEDNPQGEVDWGVESFGASLSLQQSQLTQLT